MIALLEGKLVEKRLAEVVISAGGVGYLVSVPLPTFDSLPEKGETVRLFTYLHVREELLQLYGFSTREQRATFEKVIGVAGIGPRLALSILSALTPEQLIAAVETSQVSQLNKIPGVGKKTAERMCLELKGKLGEFIAPVEGEAATASAGLGRDDEEAVAALLSLGFSRPQAERAVLKVLESVSEKLDTTELVRRALSKM